ncbi:MAG: chromosomal replication initiator DnaA [Sphingomonas sp.]|uniref:DnaA ATPase domain-containing protein n=1 Tax=Sphingomonas sp. TaxID=28214 RepID=UPI0017A55641|nr:DnaA/Hda family protein [Sphingomonas sp.]MBA3666129.1 chromosomal replication initiator DnaA [Sphingomonas sp.]
MKSAADQIALPLDWPQAEDDSRFILGDANRAAFDHFRNWTLWPVKASLLTGPRRSGRSLLARAFATRVDGHLIDRAEHHGEEELFHAWNAAQDSGRPLVMVVDEVPPAWEVALPDLRTRLAITPIARIEQPDDELFRAIVRLLFAERGLHIPEDALTLVSQRAERSYWTAERVVEAIDRFAIAERARLTMPTVRRALAEAGIIDARGAA